MSTLDSLFQRLGRCYRKREYTNKEPNVYIYTENVTGIGKNNVYNEQIHKKSIELLEEYDNQILYEYTKIKLVDKLYSREILEGTEFYRDFKEGIKVLENIVDYDVDKSKAQKLLRNIENQTVIPRAIYEENLELFSKYEQTKNYEEKQAIKREITKLTLNIKISIYGKRAKYISKNPYMPKDNILVIDLPYDSEKGLMFEETNEQNIDNRTL